MASAVLLALALLTALALPQTPEEDQAALEALRPKLSELKEDTSEDAARLREAYQEQVQLLEDLVSTAARQASLPSAEQLQQDLAQTAAALEDAASNGAEPVSLAEPDEVAIFEQALKAAQAERFSAQSAFDSIATQRREADTELAGISDRSARTTERLERITGDDEVARIKKESARLESRLVSARATYLTAALPIWEQQAALLQARLDLALVVEERAIARAEAAQAQAAELRSIEADRARREADAAEERARRERDPVARIRLNFQAEVRNVTAEDSRYDELSADLARRLEAEKTLAADLVAQRAALEDRLAMQPSGAEGLLRQYLDRSRRTRKLITDTVLPELDVEFEALQIAQAKLFDRIWVIELPPEENPELASLLATVGAERAAEATAEFQASLREDGLLEALGARSKQLEQAARQFTSLIQLTEQRARDHADFQEYILGKMLWTQSDPPMDGRALTRAWSELQRIPEPYREDQTWSRFVSNLTSHIPILLIAFGVLAGMRLLARRLAGWREFGADQPGWRRHATRFTGGLIWAAAPSITLWTFAWALFAIGGPDAFDPPFTTLLIYQADFILARRLTRVLLGKQGLLVGPQAFPPAIGAQLVRSVTVLTWAGQLCYAPYKVLAGSPFSFIVLPRLLFTGWSFAAAVAMLGLVRRRGALVQTWTIEGGLLRPIVRFMGVFCTLTLVPLFALDLLGFRVGVQRTLLNSLKVFTALFVLGALFKLVERVGLYWAERAARAGDEEDQRLIEARGLGIKAMVQGGAYIAVIASAVFLRKVLGIGEPLAKLTEDLRLLNLGTEELPQWLTLWDVLLALLYIAVGHILSSNLRALHKSLLAPFTGTTEEGTQYAGLAILRYVLLTVSYGLALLTLGVTFEALGWFATAASVGLGFGLQEIVANFISGLILLFERPVRVGDIVTIGSTSGKIESIAIRATVITNWERQTIIVPNKKFVTEDLTNWTRADKVMRRDLKVRVVYGTDVERVTALLREVVESHPAVLAEPPPNVLFQEFGLVGLEFKVLFFTAIADGLGARSQIHAQIEKRLAEAGIELAHVQRPEHLGGSDAASA